MGDSVSKKVMEELLDLSASSDDVEAGLTDLLVKQDLNKKVEALSACYMKWLKLRGEIRKCEKPDQISVDKSGKILSETFSKKAHDALKTIQEKADKISRAVEKAFKEDNYGDVFNIAKDKGDGGNKSESEADTSAA